VVTTRKRNTKNKKKRDQQRSKCVGAACAFGVFFLGGR
jgi:hypothetical protein